MVDETEYRSTYNDINATRCVFEKALMTRQCLCSRARNFRLAEREGFACNHQAAQQRCATLLGLLRRNARFALGITSAEGPLPHNKEIRVQVGGLRGLKALCGDALKGVEPVAAQTPDQPTPRNMRMARQMGLAAPLPPEQIVTDIDATVEACVNRYERLDALPFDKIIPAIVAYQVKRWRRKRRSDPPPETPADE